MTNELRCTSVKLHNFPSLDPTAKCEWCQKTVEEVTKPAVAPIPLQVVMPNTTSTPEGMQTKKQTAWEVIVRQKKNRLLFGLCGVLSLVATGMLVYQGAMSKSTWGVAIVFGVMFVSFVVLMQIDREIHDLDLKYGSGEWRIWTLTSMLKRNNP